MKNKSIIKVLTTFVLVVLLTSGSVYMPAGAASNAQIQDEINRLEKESQKLEAEIAELKKDKAEQQKIKNKLTAQINNTQAEISACQKLISGYKTEIKAYEAEIAAKEAEIEDTKYLFRQRMRSIYMSGSTNNDLMVLLDAESFSDYLALSEVSKTIAAHDKKIVSTITEAIDTINSSKKAINEKMAAQNEIKKTLASKQAKLKTQQAEINGVIASISTDQKELEKDNKAYEAAIDRLEAEIQGALSGATGSNNPVFTSGQFLWPVPGYYNVTSYYGQRWGRLHGGIDIASAGIEGKPIIAVADGVVLAAGYNTGGFGNWVMINHGTYKGKQYSTICAHMKYTPIVKNGQKVKAGQVIGYVGNTGRSYGNHCHFEVRVNGSRTNPMNYFNRAK